jgi:uncharacterized protein YjiS (DUF1127 family)
MAYQSNLTNTAYHGLVDRITAMFAEYRVNMARRKVYRDTLRELQALGPRELNDLGMNASMLKRVAYQAAYEK